jgi:(E)-4-hydroxy-3-methylbut-2-enyl-diphosphate synthase
MALHPRKPTHPVNVGNLVIGGGAPIAVQSMTNTDTEDAEATAEQIVLLAEAGSELVRITVNTPRAAEAVPEIVARVRDAGITVPIVGDFHFNGDRLLSRFPDCAKALDKYRINPGNVGRGKKKEDAFATLCKIARDNGKPVRIGVNMGSLDPELVLQKMQENTDRRLNKSSDEIMNECMIISALESTERALSLGLTENQIIISCKTSQPIYLIQIYRELSDKTRQPLHLGLTEAGMGAKGLVWSAAAMAVLLAEGIGDTVRTSLTPAPNGDRREEVYASIELLQALGLRQFTPSITACPGCGRTSSTTFQQLAHETEQYIRARMPFWKEHYEGVAALKVAVMGCVVNGPGESKAAHIGISLPGNGEAPVCPVFADGEKIASLSGSRTELTARFLQLVEEYVATHFPRRTPSEGE